MPKWVAGNRILEKILEVENKSLKSDQNYLLIRMKYLRITAGSKNIFHVFWFYKTGP